MTVEALKESIEVWKEKLEKESTDDIELGPAYCPLCRLYNTPLLHPDDACKDCVIYEKTQMKYCEGTVYDKASNALGDWRRAEINENGTEARKYKKRFHKHANKMVKFLESLLPEQE